MRCPTNPEPGHRYQEADVAIETPIAPIESHACDYDDCTVPYRWKCELCGALICDRHSHPGTPWSVKSWVCDPNCLHHRSAKGD